jgi:hypothetical protein
MAIALVQVSAVLQNGIATLPANSTAGNTLIMVMGGATITPPPSGWITGASEGVAGAEIFYYPNCPGGQTSFGTWTNSPSDSAIAEFSGLGATVILDTSASVGGTTTPQTATTSGNVTSATSLAVGLLCASRTTAGADTLTVGSGWTSDATDNSVSLTTHILLEHLINPASGSTLSQTCSCTSSHLSQFDVMMLVLKSPTRRIFISS